MKTRKPVMLAAVGGAALMAITAYAQSQSQTVGQGTMAHSELFGGPATVFMRTLTIMPQTVLGWHYHPGVGAYTIVTQGTLVVEDGCGGEAVYFTGDAFLEPPNRVHRSKNLTGSDVVTAQTFIVPEGTPTAVSTTQRCGPPRSVNECQNAGWMNFDHPRTFHSQGDCQQYVITGRRITDAAEYGTRRAPGARWCIQSRSGRTDRRDPATDPAAACRSMGGASCPALPIPPLQ